MNHTNSNNDTADGNSTLDGSASSVVTTRQTTLPTTITTAAPSLVDLQDTSSYSTYLVITGQLNILPLTPSVYITLSFSPSPSSTTLFLYPFSSLPFSPISLSPSFPSFPPYLLSLSPPSLSSPSFPSSLPYILPSLFPSLSTTSPPHSHTITHSLTHTK